MSIPISNGTGESSVAANAIGGLQYQQIKVVDGTDASTNKWRVDADGTARVSVMGVVNISGSVIAVPTGNQSVSGTVGASVIGHAPVVIVGGSVAASVTPAANQSVSGTVGASVIGWVPIQTSNTSIITRWSDSSVITRWSDSSVIALVAPNASLVQGTADLRVVQGGSVAALAAPGASIRYYVNAVQVSNFGPSSVLVTIRDNTTSTLGWTIAPAGGGSNYNPMYRAAVNSPVTASLSGTASVLVSMQGYTAT